MSIARLVPWVVHEVIEYVAAVLFLLAPFLFDFDDQTARVASWVIGGVILVVAVVSRGRLGITNDLPTQVHATLDYVLAAFLIVAPFVLGFAADTTATTFFVLLGVAHGALSLLTRFPRREPAKA